MSSQTTPTALKELARDIDIDKATYSQFDSRRGRGNITATKISQPFRPVAHPAVKRTVGAGNTMSSRSQSIGRRNNGQYESSSPASRGGGAGRALVERSSQKTKKKIVTEDYGDY